MLISRWSSLECPSCSVLLNRSLNLQVFMVSTAWLPIVLIVAILPIPIWVRLALGAVSITTYMIALPFIDASTVRLYRAHRRSGLGVLLGHRVEKDPPTGDEAKPG